MGRGTTILGGLVLAAAGGAGGAAGVLALRPAPDTTALSDLGAPAGDELAALTERVAALEAQTAQLPPLATDDAATDGAPTPTSPTVAADGGGDGGTDGTGATPVAGGPAPGAPGAVPGQAPLTERTAKAVGQMARSMATLRKRVQRLEDAGAAIDVSELEPDELAQMAAEASEAKQRAKALRLYGALLERDPDHPKAGDARLQFGWYSEDDAEAARHLEEFVARDEGHDWHRFGNFYLARRYEKLGDPVRAARTFQSGLGTSDDNPFFGIWTRSSLAKLAEADGDAAAAEQWRREALAKHGDCEWGSVQSALSEIRKALGIPEPAKKQ